MGDRTFEALQEAVQLGAAPDTNPCQAISLLLGVRLDLVDNPNLRDYQKAEILDSVKEAVTKVEQNFSHLLRCERPAKQGRPALSAL